MTGRSLAGSFESAVTVAFSNFDIAPAPVPANTSPFAFCATTVSISAVSGSTYE